jgi:phosphoribosylglycinamide formyltransferase-1
MPEPANKPTQNRLINIAIFASGTGSNAQMIIDYFKKSTIAKVKLVVCNKPQANVLKIADAENISSLVIEREKFFSGDSYLPELQNKGVDFIVLAGFLWKIPSSIIYVYPNRIINIHPALLPKFGGKNMYGNFVHEAVIKSGDKETGITIHYVDDKYDNGKIIFQQQCSIDENETAETLANKVHRLEHKNYPQVIKQIIRKEFFS